MTNQSTKTVENKHAIFLQIYTRQCSNRHNLFMIYKETTDTEALKINFSEFKFQEFLEI